MNKIRLFLCTMVFLFSCLPGQAMDIQEVITVSPAWDTFTNNDGTGLYHEILKTVYTDLYGIPVRHEFVPSLRATHLVSKAQADIMVCKARLNPPMNLVMAPSPMYANEYHAFFNKQNIPNWKGRSSMQGKSVVWRINYYDQRYIPEGMDIKEVKTGVSALGMVVLGRADFYLDDLALIKESIRASTVEFDENDFSIRPVGFRTYHPVFNTTKRGEYLLGLYEQGMKKLYDSGTLAKIFKKWDYPLPNYKTN